MDMTLAASKAEIKSAYRKQALETPPDKLGNTPKNNAAFCELNEPYQILLKSDSHETQILSTAPAGGKSGKAKSEYYGRRPNPFNDPKPQQSPLHQEKEEWYQNLERRCAYYLKELSDYQSKIDERRARSPHSVPEQVRRCRAYPDWWIKAASEKGEWLEKKEEYWQTFGDFEVGLVDLEQKVKDFEKDVKGMHANFSSTGVWDKAENAALAQIYSYLKTEFGWIQVDIRGLVPSASASASKPAKSKRRSGAPEGPEPIYTQHSGQGPPSLLEMMDHFDFYDRVEQRCAYYARELTACEPDMNAIYAISLRLIASQESPWRRLLHPDRFASGKVRTLRRKRDRYWQRLRDFTEKPRALAQKATRLGVQSKAVRVAYLSTSRHEGRRWSEHAHARLHHDYQQLRVEFAELRAAVDEARILAAAAEAGAIPAATHPVDEGQDALAYPRDLCVEMLMHVVMEGDPWQDVAFLKNYPLIRESPGTRWADCPWGDRAAVLLVFLPVGFAYACTSSPRGFLLAALPWCGFVFRSVIEYMEVYDAFTPAVFLLNSLHVFLLAVASLFVALLAGHLPIYIIVSLDRIANHWTRLTLVLFNIDERWWQIFGGLGGLFVLMLWFHPPRFAGYLLRLGQRHHTLLSMWNPFWAALQTPPFLNMKTFFSVAIAYTLCVLASLSLSHHAEEYTRR